MPAPERISRQSGGFPPAAKTQGGSPLPLLDRHPPLPGVISGRQPDRSLTAAPVDIESREQKKQRHQNPHTSPPRYPRRWRRLGRLSRVHLACRNVRHSPLLQKNRERLHARFLVSIAAKGAVPVDSERFLRKVSLGFSRRIPLAAKRRRSPPIVATRGGPHPPRIRPLWSG